MYEKYCRRLISYKYITVYKNILLIYEIRDDGSESEKYTAVRIEKPHVRKDRKIDRDRPRERERERESS